MSRRATKPRAPSGAFLSADELERLGRALAAQAERNATKVAIVRLLALTGCRLGEITSLQLVDVRGRRLHLQDSKTGPRTVWLGDEGRAVLDGVTRVKGRSEVFYDPVLRRVSTRLEHSWGGVCADAGLSGVRLHDLRHTYASHAAALSETLPVIGGLLGHRKVVTTSRYTHLDDADVLRTAKVIGDAIAAMTAC